MARTGISLQGIPIYGTINRIHLDHLDKVYLHIESYTRYTFSQYTYSRYRDETDRHQGITIIHSLLNSLA